MSSFELKPKHKVSLLHGPKASNIEWSFERDTLPPLLKEKNVELSVWQETFDAVVAQYATLYNTGNRIAHAPPVIFVSFAYVMWVVKAYKKRWTKIVEEQNEIYKPLGIVVKVIEDTEFDVKHTNMALKFEAEAS